MNPVAHDLPAFWTAMAFVALGAPLFSALIAATTPSRYAWAVSLTAPFLLLIAAVASLALLFQHGDTEAVFRVTWFALGKTTFNAGILFNPVTLVMMAVVSVISFLVHLYSTGYMAGDDHFRRYFSVLGFFTFAMMGLVMADNLFLLFIFWELVGFSSYLLIGHWYELPDAGRAARKAFLLNRVGDLGFLAGLMILFQQTGTFQLDVLPDLTGTQGMTAASLCFFLAVAGKSAQFPLLTWLPDAMAGPTPVSALIHAATMVAAGIFLLARIDFLFTPESLTVVLTVGTLTALVGALAALVHDDMKKILAFSTVSQLGFMVMGFGAGASEAAFLHLYTHAFFKAGLFLGAGSVIHAMHQAQQTSGRHFDVQNIRNLGGLREKMPLTFWIFVVCGSSLAGIPLSSGFLSKESIFAALLASGTPPWLTWFTVASAFVISFCTTLYIFRLIWNVFVKPAPSGSDGMPVTEPPFVMRLPMLALALASAFWMVSINPLALPASLHVPPASWQLTVVSAAWVLLAVGVAYRFMRTPLLPRPVAGWRAWAWHTAYLDAIGAKLVATPIKKAGQWTGYLDRKFIDRGLHGLAYGQVILAHLTGWFDRNVIDGIVNGAAWVAGTTGAVTRSLQGGHIQSYIFWGGAGLLFLVLLLLT